MQRTTLIAAQGGYIPVAVDHLDLQGSWKFSEILSQENTVRLAVLANRLEKGKRK